MKITMTPPENLSSRNFLAVCDVAMDIKEELQLTPENVVVIPLLRQIIRQRPFNILMPADDIGLRDTYCDYRLKALKYLQANGCITGFEPHSDFHRWDTKVKASVDREKFDAFYNRLAGVYQKRVVDPAKKEQEDRARAKNSTLPSEQKREPTSIKIEEMPPLKVEGLERGLEKIIQVKEGKKNKFPYRLPAGTKWENIIIKFLDDENVLISARRKEHETNFKDIGFTDNRWAVPRPNEGWLFLRVLAMLNGELSLKDPKARDKYKKQKQLLSEALQSYFSLEYDPFYPYRDTKSYKVKMTLFYSLPDKEVKTYPIDHKNAEEKLDEELEQFYKEQTPQVL